MSKFDFFRVEQERRLHEMRTCSEPTEKWPRGCRGSRRPWLVFIGPSPGGKAGLDEEASPRWNEPFTDPFTSPWGGGFKASMPSLLRVLMPEATEAERPFLYAVYNLDSVQKSRAPDVPEERMREGVKAIISLLEQSPPRLIVPMESLSFNRFKEALREHGYDVGPNNAFLISVPIYDNPKGAQKFHRALSGFRIAGNGALNDSIVVRLSQHPAHIFTAAYAERCAKAVRSLFERLAEPTSD